jgi:hypothetical protein
MGKFLVKANQRKKTGPESDGDKRMQVNSPVGWAPAPQENPLKCRVSPEPSAKI